eukprot:1015874-Pyramimonas_sp.AAC.1
MGHAARAPCERRKCQRTPAGRGLQARPRMGRHRNWRAQSARPRLRAPGAASACIPPTTESAATPQFDQPRIRRSGV